MPGKRNKFPIQGQLPPQQRQFKYPQYPMIHNNEQDQYSAYSTSPGYQQSMHKSMNMQQQQSKFNYPNAGNNGYNTYNTPVSQSNRFYPVQEQIIPQQHPIPQSPQQPPQMAPVQNTRPQRTLMPRHMMPQQHPVPQSPQKSPQMAPVQTPQEAWVTQQQIPQQHSVPQSPQQPPQMVSVQTTQPQQVWVCQQRIPQQHPVPQSSQQPAQIAPVQNTQHPQAWMPQQQIPAPYSMVYPPNPYGMNMHLQYQQFGYGNYLPPQYNSWSYQSNFDLITLSYPKGKPPSETSQKEHPKQIQPMESPTSKRAKLTTPIPTPNFESPQTSPINPHNYPQNIQNQVLQQPQVKPLSSPLGPGNKPAVPAIYQSNPPQFASSPHTEQEWNQKTANAQQPQSTALLQDVHDPNKSQNIVTKDVPLSVMDNQNLPKTPITSLQNVPSTVLKNVPSNTTNVPKNMIRYLNPVVIRPSMGPPGLPGNPQQVNSTPSSLEGLESRMISPLSKGLIISSQAQNAPNPNGTHLAPQEVVNTVHILDVSYPSKEEKQVKTSDSIIMPPPPPPSQNQPVHNQNVQMAPQNMSEAPFNTTDNETQRFNNRNDSAHFERNQTQQQPMPPQTFDNINTEPTNQASTFPSGAAGDVVNQVKSSVETGPVSIVSTSNGNSLQANANYGNMNSIGFSSNSPNMGRIPNAYSNNEQQPRVYQDDKSQYSYMKKTESNNQNMNSNKSGDSSYDPLDLPNILMSEDDVFPIATAINSSESTDSNKLVNLELNESVVVDNINASRSFEHDSDMRMAAPNVDIVAKDNSPRIENKIVSDSDALLSNQIFQQMHEILAGNLETYQFATNRTEYFMEIDLIESSKIDQNSSVNEINVSEKLQDIEANFSTIEVETPINCLGSPDLTFKEISNPNLETVAAESKHDESNQDDASSTNNYSPHSNLSVNEMNVVAMDAEKTEKSESLTNCIDRLDVHDNANLLDFADIENILQEVVETVVMNSVLERTSIEHSEDSCSMEELENHSEQVEDHDLIKMNENSAENEADSVCEMSPRNILCKSDSNVMPIIIDCEQTEHSISVAECHDSLTSSTAEQCSEFLGSKETEMTQTAIENSDVLMQSQHSVAQNNQEQKEMLSEDNIVKMPCEPAINIIGKELLENVIAAQPTSVAVISATNKVIMDLDDTMDDLFGEAESIICENDDESDYDEDYIGSPLNWPEILARQQMYSGPDVPRQEVAVVVTERQNDKPIVASFVNQSDINVGMSSTSSVNESTTIGTNDSATSSDKSSSCFFPLAKSLRKRKIEINQYGTVRKKSKTNLPENEQNVDQTNLEIIPDVNDSNEVSTQNGHMESTIVMNREQEMIVVEIDDNQISQSHFFGKAVVTKNNKQMPSYFTEENVTENNLETSKNLNGNQLKILNSSELNFGQEKDNVKKKSLEASIIVVEDVRTELENTEIDENEASNVSIEHSVTTAVNQGEIMKEKEDLEELLNDNIIETEDQIFEFNETTCSLEEPIILTTNAFESVSGNFVQGAVNICDDLDAQIDDPTMMDLDPNDLITENDRIQVADDNNILMEVRSLLSDILCHLEEPFVHETLNNQTQQSDGNVSIESGDETEIETFTSLVDAEPKDILATVVSNAAFNASIQTIFFENGFRKMSSIIVRQVSYLLAEHCYQLAASYGFTEMELESEEIAAKFVLLEREIGKNTKILQHLGDANDRFTSKSVDFCHVIHQSKLGSCMTNSSSKKLSLSTHFYYVQSIIQSYQQEESLTNDKYFAIISLLCPSRIDAVNYCLEDFTTRKQLLFKCINFLASIIEIGKFAVSLFVCDRYILEKIVDGFNDWLESAAKTIGKFSTKEKQDFFKQIQILQKQFIEEVGEEHDKLTNCILSSLTTNFKVFGDQIAPVTKKLYPLPACVDQIIQEFVTENISTKNNQCMCRWIKIMFQTTFGSRVLRFAKKSTLEKQKEFYRFVVGKFSLFLSKLPLLLENHRIENGIEILQNFTDDDFLLFLQQEQLLKDIAGEFLDTTDENRAIFQMLTVGKSEKLSELEKLKMEQEIFADIKVENFLKKQSPKIMLPVKSVLSVIDVACEQLTVKEYHPELFLIRDSKGFAPESLQLLEKSIDFLWTVFDALPKTNLIKCLVSNPLLDGDEDKNFLINGFSKDSLAAFLDLLNHISISNGPKKAYLNRANTIVNEIGVIAWRMAIVKDRTKELPKLNEDVWDIATCLADEMAKTSNLKKMKMQNCCDSVIIFTTLLFHVKSFPDVNLSEISEKLGAICFGGTISMIASGSTDEVTSLFAEKLKLEAERITDEYFGVLYSKETFLFPPLMSQNHTGILKLKYMLVELFAFLHDPAKFVWLILHVAKQREILMTMINKVVKSLKVIVSENSIHSTDMVFDTFKALEFEADVLEQIMSEFELKKTEEGILLLLIGLYWTDPEQQPALRLINISRFFDCPSLLFEKFGFLFDENVKNVDIRKLYKFYYNDYLIKKVIDPDYQNVLYSDVENDLYNFYCFIDLNLPAYSEVLKSVMKHLLPDCLRNVSETSRRRALSVSF